MSTSPEPVKEEVASSPPASPTPNKTPKRTPKKRAAESNVSTPRKAQKLSKVPTSADELTPADKKLLQMRENGKKWTEIVAMWFEETGVEVVYQTLQVRFAKLKANLSRIEPEHQVLLLETYAEVDAKIEEEYKAQKKKLFQRIVEEMAAKCDVKYEVGTAEKEYKRLSAAKERGEKKDDALLALVEAGAENFED